MDLKGLETVTFSTTRFFSSSFDQWQKIYESYKALIENYKRCRQDDEDETKYQVGIQNMYMFQRVTDIFPVVNNFTTSLGRN